MTRPPKWYLPVVIVALAWAAIGCVAYLTQVSMGAADLAALPAAERDVWIAMPAWVKGAYAIAVWSSLAGAIMLAARSRHARAAYIVSLAAIVAQFGWTFLATPILTTVGPASAAFPLFIAAAGLMLVWFAGHARKRNWLQ